MAYGTVKVDNVTFTYNAADATTTFSGFYASTTNNLTLSGTASAATFTGTTANFTNANVQNISVTTLLSGLAITGGTAGFTIVTGTTVTGTTANFVTVSGTTVTGNTGQFTSITGGTAGFTTVTGTTVTGTTANFVTLSGTTTTFTSGIIASGTALLPSLAILSDPNTGIFSPGADQLAISTNGTGQVFVDASGSVGFGLTPNAYGNNSRLTLQGTGLNNTIYSNFNGGGNDKHIVLTNGVSANTYIGTNNTSLTFGTGSAERMHITSAGTVNIVGAGTAGSSQAVSFNGSAPINSLVMDSGGLVGLGTSSPGGVLSSERDLSTSGTAFAGKFYDTATNRGYGSPLLYVRTPNDTSSSSAIGMFGVGDNADTSELGNLFRITQTGQVGIGTTGPGFKVDIVSDNNTSLAAVLRVNSNNLAVNASLAYDGLIGSGELYVRTSSANKLYLGTNATNALTIDSSQRVGIGTTSPKSLLTVNGNIVGLSETTHSLQHYQQASSSFTVTSIDSVISGASGSLVFKTGANWTNANATESMRIKSDGDVSIVTGNLIIGTAGKGIDFSADGSAAGMTSELLDDYEEGTFTPSLAYQTPGTSSITQSSDGSYTKVGNLVYIQITVALTGFTKGTASGELRITGLPFALRTGLGSTAFALTFYSTPLPTLAGQFPIAETFSGQTYITLFVASNNSTSFDFTDPDSNANYKLSGSYLV